MKTGFIIAAFVIILAVAGLFLYQIANKTGQVEKAMEETGEVMEKDQEMMKSMEEEEMMEKEQGTMEEDQTPGKLAGSATPYYIFDQALYEKALEENKVILLYFFADWCPICAREQRDATLPAFDELQKPNIVGFRIHYNDGLVTVPETSLARQFGITYQHTKVILQNGDQVLKDLNSWDKSKYIEELNKF